MESKKEKAAEGGAKEKKQKEKPQAKKEKKPPQARADDGDAEVQQRMVGNLLSRIGSITQDPVMRPMLYGADDSMFNVDRPTVLHSESNSDIDYIVIPI